LAAHNIPDEHFRFAMTVIEVAVGIVRKSAKKRNKTSGDQTERGGMMREEGKTGYGLHLLSMGGEAPTLFKYPSVGSTGRDESGCAGSSPK
jgi:hypothetical protein